MSIVIVFPKCEECGQPVGVLLGSPATKTCAEHAPTAGAKKPKAPRAKRG